jgi:hypothetical protein
MVAWIWPESEPKGRQGRPRRDGQDRAAFRTRGQLVYRELLWQRFRAGESTEGLGRAIQSQARQFLAAWVPLWADAAESKVVQLADLLAANEFLRYAIPYRGDWQEGVRRCEEDRDAFRLWEPEVTIKKAIENWKTDAGGRRLHRDRLASGEGLLDARLDFPFPDGWPALREAIEHPVVGERATRSLVQWDEYFGTVLPLRASIRRVLPEYGDWGRPLEKRYYLAVLRRIQGGRDLLARVVRGEGAARALLWEGGSGFPPLVAFSRVTEKSQEAARSGQNQA